MKYASAMPVSGTRTSMGLRLALGLPPSRWYTWPAACTVMTRHAMLKSVRYTGLRDREFSVDGPQPRAAPTIIVACGPRRISEAMSTTYDTDMFEPLAIGNCTLNAEVSDERRMRNSSGGTGASDSV